MKYVLAVLAIAGLMTVSAQGVVITKWTFETSIPTTGGPHAAEVGTGQATGVHADAGAVFSNPVGNGSAESFSSDRWQLAGDNYYQFQTSTTGLSNLALTFDQTRSSTGPSGFEVLYSTNGTSFTQLGTYTLVADGWSSGTYHAVSTFFFVLPAALDNQANIYIRLRATTLGSATTSTCRVDNVTISQGELPTPGSQTVNINSSASPTATDITLSDTYNCKITSLSVANYPTTTGTGGTLSDPNGGNITTTPYTLLSNGKVVRFTPTANVSGWYKFNYRVVSGASESADATVNVLIQSQGKVVVTEIMYSPANTNFDDPNHNLDSDWEWVEIKNLTAGAITLGTFYDGALTTTDNINGYVLPANGIKILAKPDRGSFSLSTLETEWNIVGQNLVFQMLAVGQAGEPRLGNNADSLLLFAQDGSLLDRIAYDVGANSWPTLSHKSSIYLEFNKLTTFDNDSGANWHRSVAGACGAYATPQADESPNPAVDDGDVGSPGLLPSQLCSSAPIATNDSTKVLKDSNPGPIITLTGSDPDGSPVVFTVLTGPSSGTLTDPNNAEANVTGGGVLTGDQVRYTPAASFTGDVTLTFKVNDGTGDSNTATFTIHVVTALSNSLVRINEVYLNNTGADTIEFYELYGPPSTSLNNMTLVEIDGDGNAKGAINHAWSLAGQSIPADGLFVLGVDGCPNQDLTMGPIGGGQIQNGTSTFVLVENYVAPAGGDIDSANTGNSGIYIGDIADAVGVTDADVGDSNYFAAPVIGRTPAPHDAAGIARLCDGVDTNATADWTWTSEDLLPPSTGTGVDGFVASSPGVSNNPLYGGSCTTGQNPVLSTAVSRKTHGGFGTYDVNLLAVGATECRANGPTVIVATFQIPIQTISGNASVSLSSGSVSSLVVAGSQLTINMSGATPNVPLTVGFPGVADANNAAKTSASTLCVGDIVGDSNQDKSTDIFDLVVIRNVLNQHSTGVTFRMDVTANGDIDIFDLVFVRNNLNAHVAACP